MDKKALVNHQIRYKEVRVVDETKGQLGIMPLGEALRLARERGLDLIQVSEKTVPPICKIMDYGKYRYIQGKKKKKIKKSMGGEIKAIRLGFNISDNDLKTKANLVKKFLEEGDKVKIEMTLRGRQNRLRSFAEEKIKKFVAILDTITPAKIEKGLEKRGNRLGLIIIKR